MQQYQLHTYILLYRNLPSSQIRNILPWRNKCQKFFKEKQSRKYFSLTQSLTWSIKKAHSLAFQYLWHSQRRFLFISLHVCVCVCVWRPTAIAKQMNLKATTKSFHKVMKLREETRWQRTRRHFITSLLTVVIVADDKTQRNYDRADVTATATVVTDAANEWTIVRGGRLSIFLCV